MSLDLFPFFLSLAMLVRPSYGSVNTLSYICENLPCFVSVNVTYVMLLSWTQRCIARVEVETNKNMCVLISFESVQGMLMVLSK